MAYVSKRKQFEVGSTVYINNRFSWQKATVTTPPVRDETSSFGRSYAREVERKTKSNEYVYVTVEGATEYGGHPMTKLVPNKVTHILPETEGAAQVAADKAQQEREAAQRNERRQAEQSASAKLEQDLLAAKNSPFAKDAEAICDIARNTHGISYDGRDKMFVQTVAYLTKTFGGLFVVKS